MTSCAQRIDTFGQGIARGERVPDLAWLGRAGRAVPSHQSVAALVTGSARLLAGAKDVVLPTPAAEEPLACPNLVRPGSGAPTTSPARPRLVIVPVAPLETVAPISDARPDEPTLRAIRSLIVEAHTELPTRPLRQPAATAPDAVTPTMLQTARSGANRLIWRACVHVLAWGLVGLAFPLGAVKATMFHLNGGDLRDWS